MLLDHEYEQIKRKLANREYVTHEQYRQYISEHHWRTRSEQQRTDLRHMLYWEGRSPVADFNDLPMFEYRDKRFYTCPHCQSKITFTQLGHAHRWGWCPYCARYQGHQVIIQIVQRLGYEKALTEVRKGEATWAKNKQHQLLACLHYIRPLKIQRDPDSPIEPIIGHTFDDAITRHEQAEQRMKSNHRRRKPRELTDDEELF